MSVVYMVVKILVMYVHLSRRLAARLKRLVDRLHRLGRLTEEQLLHLRVRGHDAVERGEAVELAQQLQVHVAVVVRVREDELEGFAQLDAMGLPPHARPAARTSFAEIIIRISPGRS